MNQTRPKILLITIYICFIAILGKLFYWQIIKGASLREKASSQIYQLNEILPEQGHILSSDNFPLSLDYTYYTLSLYRPNFKQDLTEILKKISQIKPEFATQNAKILDKFNNPNQKWLDFPTVFTRQQSNQLQKIPGLSFQIQQKRFYPETNLANNLILNLERYYHRQISGSSGFSRSIIAGTGESLLTHQNWQKKALNGQDIHLTLNRQIQSLAENVIKNGVERYQADSASVIIISPQNGALLAMASYEASPSAQNTTKISNISDLFEPGSIFKPLIMASALDSQSINSDFICENCNRPRVIGQYTINNWNEEFHPNSTLTDIIKNSDNIGMSYIIDRLGLNKFLDYFHRLKFDQKTGIELVGESISPLKTYWADIDLATASFGQGLAINQLQMLQAFNTLANNGQLVSVHLNQETSPQNSPVFFPDTVDKMKEILKYAVNHSPVSNFNTKNMEVCAKSGTAQVAVKGGYTDANTIGSYIGFSPCNEAKFTMIVTINNPRSSPWGSSTAAPLWFELAQNIEPLL